MVHRHIIKNLSSFRNFANEHLQNLSLNFDGPGWKSGTKHHNVQEYRYFLMFRKILEYFPEHGPKAIDLGCYPGDIGILFKKIYGNDSTIYGCGLNFSEEFLQMALNYYDEMLYTELDPENPLGSKAEKTLIDLPNKEVDLIIAGEIFEHLYNPLHFISECSRILSDTGIIILTTDNLKYIGTFFGLLRNKTPFSELKDSHIFMKSEWRPHERLYLRHEIAELFRMYNLEVKEHFFFDNYYETYKRLPFSSKVNQTICKMFYIIPSFRPKHFFVFKKSGSQ